MQRVLACISGTMVGMYYQAIDSTMGAMIGMGIFKASAIPAGEVLPGAVVGGFIFAWELLKQL